jgi:hypothetical protein
LDEFEAGLLEVVVFLFFVVFSEDSFDVAEGGPGAEDDGHGGVAHVVYLDVSDGQPHIVLFYHVVAPPDHMNLRNHRYPINRHITQLNRLEIDQRYTDSPQFDNIRIPVQFALKFALFGFSTLINAHLAFN